MKQFEIVPLCILFIQLQRNRQKKLRTDTHTVIKINISTNINYTLSLCQVIYNNSQDKLSRKLSINVQNIFSTILLIIDLTSINKHEKCIVYRLYLFSLNMCLMLVTSLIKLPCFSSSFFLPPDDAQKHEEAQNLQ